MAQVKWLHRVLLCVQTPALSARLEGLVSDLEYPVIRFDSPWTATMTDPRSELLFLETGDDASAFMRVVFRVHSRHWGLPRPAIIGLASSRVLERNPFMSMLDIQGWDALVLCLDYEEDGIDGTLARLLSKWGPARPAGEYG